MSDAPETEPVVTEPVVEAPSEAPVEAPKEESAEAPAEAPAAESVSAQELTDKVRETLTELPAPVKSDKERIKDLENKVNKLVEILKSSYRQVEMDDNVWNWTMDLINKREEFGDL